jgi:hypothetical protein
LSAEPDKPDLAPLVCAQCGAPVPLGESDRTHCGCCSAEVELPAEYVAMRAAGRVDAAEHARAAKLAAALARPPGFFVRLWSVAAVVTALISILVLAVWIVVGVVMCAGMLLSIDLDSFYLAIGMGLVLAIPLTYNELLHGLARGLGTDWADAWGGAGSYALLGLGFYLVLAMPMIIGAFADSFETVRTKLRTILAAKPPRAPGGAAECRLCGAALELAPGELHQRCVYCRADNLLDLPDKLVDKASEHAATDHRDVESAFAAERKARRGGLWTLGKRALWWLALVPVCVLFGRCVAAVNGDSPTFWQRATADAPMVPNQSHNPPLGRGRATLFSVHKSFDECSEQCTAYYFVSLAAGERLHMVVTQAPLSFARLQARSIGAWYNPTYEWKDIDDSRGVPYRGWYRVVLTTPKKLDPVDPLVEWDAVR